MGEHDVAILACDAALEIDPRSSKALFRRAMSRIAPVSAGGVEYDSALGDLSLAYSIAPDDRVVAGKLRQLKALRKQQSKTDKKTFSGMFDRGNVYLEENEKKIVDRMKVGTGGAAGEGMDENDPDDCIEKRIYEAEQMYSMYMKQEKFEEADELRTKIDTTREAKKKMEEREKNGGGGWGAAGEQEEVSRGCSERAEAKARGYALWAVVQRRERPKMRLERL